MESEHDIVAYIFKADVYCPNCIVHEVIMRDIGEFGEDGEQSPGGIYFADTKQGRTVVCDPMMTYTVLCRIADTINIDFENEETYDSEHYDSGDFPKHYERRFLQDANDEVTCGRCHATIGI
jgi:hypothetical protein